MTSPSVLRPAPTPGQFFGPPAEIVGRMDERQQVDAFVASVAAGASGLIIRGDAGIGKTAMWRHATAACRRAGQLVLSTRGAEEEMTGDLIGLVDLFEDTDHDDVVLCGDVDPFVRGRAVLHTLRRLSAVAPVVLAVDDLQWLDPGTARTLRYALRRVDRERVGVLATWRSGSGSENRLALSSTLPPGRAARIELCPLDSADLRRLLAGYVDVVSPMTLHTIHAVSGGNPLYAIELIRSVAATGGGAVDAATIALPDSLVGAIEEHLRSVPAELHEVLEMLAASGPVPTETLAGCLPGMHLGEMLQAAERCGVLVVETDHRIRFDHPLMASAVYRGMSPMRRCEVHASLAEGTVDTEARVRHLALSVDGPDASLASQLERAAQRARRRGAPETASSLARHSVRLTPEPYLADRHRRSLIVITALAAAGEAQRALSLVDELVAALPPGPERAEALVQRFYVENGDVDVADATLLQALEDAADDEELRCRVLDILGWFRGVFAGDLRGGIECGQRAVDIAEALDDPHLWMLAAAHLAHMQALAGSPRPEMMEEAVAIADTDTHPELGGGPHAWLAKQALWAGDLVASEHGLRECLETLTSAGNELERSYRLYDLSLLGSAAGRFHEALGLAERAVEAASDGENQDAEGWAHYPLGLAQMWTGDVAAARNTADRLLSWPGRPGNHLGAVRAHSVLGLVALGEGDFRQAATALRKACQLADRGGVAHPGAIPVVADAVIALAGAGRSENSHALLDVLEAQQTALDTPRTTAMWHHAAGVVATAEARLDTAIAHLEDAIATFDLLGLVPDAARALLALGQALARDGRRIDGADRVGAARDRFVAMGSPVWADLCGSELSRIRPGHGGGGLTGTQHRIAELVAEGRRNREIASALFISVTTVEGHLTRIYRQLDIRSRTDLARLVLDGAIPSPE